MIGVDKAFNGFSVNDLAAAKDFYGTTLGVQLEEIPAGLRLKIGNGILVYPKKDHQPATFTMLNFRVGDIDQAVDALTQRGVQFQHYAQIPQMDDKGVMRARAHHMGPDIAWFTDPAGNILAVLQED